MKRRAFFGFLGGAAVAGPTLSKSLAAEAVAHMPMPPIGGGYASAGLATSGHDDWKLRQIKRLKAIISGKDPDAEQNDVMNRLYSAESLERYRLDSLRSVSPTHRMQMLTNGANHRRDRVRRADAEFDLARILRGD